MERCYLVHLMRYLSYERRDEAGSPVPETARYSRKGLEMTQNEALWDILPEDDEPWWDQELEEE